MIKYKHKELLQHMLGADERYKKKQWGFRNHFCSNKGNKYHEELLKMQGLGLVKSGIQLNYTVFWATKEGAKAIGFKAYQIRNTDFPS